MLLAGPLRICLEELIMATLTRWSPFKSLARMEQASPFDDFMRGMSLRPHWADLEAPEMRIDVTENEKVYAVKAEIPGVQKDDIDVSIDGNLISISAETKRETKRGDNEHELFTERYYGKIYRTVSLPSDVDNTKASAHYENGVLTLELPKKGNGSARRITIS